MRTIFKSYGFFISQFLFAAVGSIEAYSQPSDIRTVMISAKNDFETDNIWPELSFQKFQEFCQPGNDETRIDMMRKAGFANTAVNAGEMFAKILMSPLKDRMKFTGASSSSVYGEIEMADLEILRWTVRDDAEVYDLTGAVVFPAGLQ